MGWLFNNPEFKTTVKKLGFVFVLGLIILISLCYMHMNRLNEMILRNNQIVAGNLIKSHPELEQEIMSSLASASIEDQKTGEGLLNKYGYTKEMPYYMQPLLKGELGKIELTSVFFLLLLACFVFFVLYAGYKKIYGKIRNITKFSENVMDGKIEYLSEQGEGDFAILGHSFNRMAESVKTGMELERNDKELLRNAISDISHQIRTPLSSVMMFNELMLDNRDMESVVREDFLKKSSVQLSRIQWLIESLLKMAMLESKTIVFEKSNVFVIDLLQKCTSSLYMLSKERQVAVKIETDESARIFCDEKWTEEACINIIKNALEHTNPDGEVKISSQADTIFTRIVIKDNGTGIDKKDIPHIFERFYKGGQTPDAKSVGVGLSLSKLIIEGQGGLISVKSQPQTGTEFEIVFPALKNRNSY